MTTQATAVEAVEAIQAALAVLPADADSPWTNLDKMPYIHKADDPKASPWNCAVVGRFDYLQTMQYMLACQPSNIRAVLASLAASQKEIVMLREACAAMVKYDDNDHEDGVQMMFEYNDAITKARAALSQGAKP